MRNSIRLALIIGLISSTAVSALASAQQSEPADGDVLVLGRVVSNRQVVGNDGNGSPTPTPTPAPTSSPTPTPSTDLTPSWAYGPWSEYSTTCGSGTRTRTFECVGLDASDNSTSIPVDACSALPDPVTTESANVRSGCFYDVGDWSEWSNTCGLGTRTRTIGCATLNEGEISPVSFNFCDALGSVPVSSETTLVKTSCVTLLNPDFDVNTQGWFVQSGTWQSGGVNLTGRSAAHLAGIINQSFATTPGFSYEITVSYRVTSGCSRAGWSPFSVSAMNGTTVQSVYHNPVQVVCTTPGLQTFNTTFVANTNSTKVEVNFRADSLQIVGARIESINAVIL